MVLFLIVFEISTHMLKRGIEFFLKDFPAWFWNRPTLYRFLSWPLVLLYQLTHHKKSDNPISDKMSMSKNKN